MDELASYHSGAEPRQFSTTAHRARYNKYDLSVVVPVFNTREYVAKCLRSILVAGRDLQLQLICVDDGSQDDSVRVISDFFRENSVDATLIEQAQQGQGAARNAALPLIKGEFFACIDSDDLVGPDCFDALIGVARAYKCDVVWGRIKQFYDDFWPGDAWVNDENWTTLLGEHKGIILCPRKDYRVCFLEAYPSCRIVRSNFARNHQLTYPRGLYEDVPYHVKLLSAAENVAIVNVPTWHYRTGRKGQVSAERSRRRFDLIDNFRLALREMYTAKLSNEHGAAFLQSGVCPLFWSSLYLPLASRGEYFSRACDAFRSVPPEWLAAYYRLTQPNPLWFVIWCLKRHQIQALVRRSAGAKAQPWNVLRFYYDAQGLAAAANAAFTVIYNRCRRARR